MKRALVHAVSHGIIGGLCNLAVGQKFRAGFMSAAVAAFIMHSPVAKGAKGAKSSLGFDDPDKLGDVMGRTAVAATLGGTVEALSGGDFANGAYTSAFQHLFNNEVDS